MHRVTDTATDLESHIGYASLGAKKLARLNPPYHLSIHSIRKRLGDVDGISAKAAIDGLIAARVLTDDSAQYIQSVTYSQEKGAEEKTLITIRAVA